MKRKRNSADVIDALTDLFSIRGDPACIRSGNGPEFIAVAVTKSSAQRLLILSPELLGRTAVARTSTPVSGTNS